MKQKPATTFAEPAIGEIWTSVFSGYYGYHVASMIVPSRKTQQRSPLETAKARGRLGGCHEASDTKITKSQNSFSGRFSEERCAAEIEKLAYTGLNSCLPDLFHSICNSPKSFHDSRIDGGNFDHLWLKKFWFSAHGAIWLYGSAHNVERNAVVTLKTFLRVAKYIKLIRFQQIIDWFGQCFYLGCTTPPAKGCRFLEKI